MPIFLSRQPYWRLSALAGNALTVSSGFSHFLAHEPGLPFHPHCIFTRTLAWLIGCSGSGSVRFRCKRHCSYLGYYLLIVDPSFFPPPYHLPFRSSSSFKRPPLLFLLLFKSPLCSSDIRDTIIVLRLPPSALDLCLLSSASTVASTHQPNPRRDILRLKGVRLRPQLL